MKCAKKVASALQRARAGVKSRHAITNPQVPSTRSVEAERTCTAGVLHSSSSSRLASFSVEIVAPESPAHVDTFESCAAACASDQRLGFLTIGCKSPLGANPIALDSVRRISDEMAKKYRQVSLEALRREGAGDGPTEQMGAGVPQSPLLVLNATCRGTSAEALEALLKFTTDLPVPCALCVMSGIGVPGPNDAFQYPTEMLKFLRIEAPEVECGAAGTPSPDPSERMKDWHYVAEKVANGASFIMSTPIYTATPAAPASGQSVPPLLEWLREAQAFQSRRLTRAACSTDDCGKVANTTSTEVDTPQFVMSCLASLRSGMLWRIARARRWSFPETVTSASGVGEIEFAEAFDAVTADMVRAALCEHSLGHVHVVAYENDAERVFNLLRKM